MTMKGGVVNTFTAEVLEWVGRQEAAITRVIEARVDRDAGLRTRPFNRARHLEQVAAVDSRQADLNRLDRQMDVYGCRVLIEEGQAVWKRSPGSPTWVRCSDSLAGVGGQISGLGQNLDQRSPQDNGVTWTIMSQDGTSYTMRPSLCRVQLELPTSP